MGPVRSGAAYRFISNDLVKTRAEIVTNPDQPYEVLLEGGRQNAKVITMDALAPGARDNKWQVMYHPATLFIKCDDDDDQNVGRNNVNSYLTDGDVSGNHTKTNIKGMLQQEWVDSTQSVAAWPSSWREYESAVLKTQDIGYMRWAQKWRKSGRQHGVVFLTAVQVGSPQDPITVGQDGIIFKNIVCAPTTARDETYNVEGTVITKIEASCDTTDWPESATGEWDASTCPPADAGFSGVIAKLGELMTSGGNKDEFNIVSVAGGVEIPGIIIDSIKHIEMTEWMKLTDIKFHHLGGAKRNKTDQKKKRSKGPKKIIKKEVEQGLLKCDQFLRNDWRIRDKYIEIIQSLGHGAPRGNVEQIGKDKFMEIYTRWKAGGAAADQSALFTEFSLDAKDAKALKLCLKFCDVKLKQTRLVEDRRATVRVSLNIDVVINMILDLLDTLTLEQVAALRGSDIRRGGMGFSPTSPVRVSKKKGRKTKRRTRRTKKKSKRRKRKSRRRKKKSIMDLK
jgi:hypothetical protein